MDNRKYYLRCLKFFIDEQYEPPTTYGYERRLGFSMNDFKRKSYSHWAVNELYNRIKRRPEIDPELLGEQFLSELFQASIEKKSYAKIFNYAMPAVEDMLEYMDAL